MDWLKSMIKANSAWAKRELHAVYDDFAYVGSELERMVDEEEAESYQKAKSFDKNERGQAGPSSHLVTTDLVILDGKYDRSEEYPGEVTGPMGPVVFRLLRERWWTDVLAKALQENEVLWYLFTRKLQAEMPELFASHPMPVLREYEGRPKVDFDWLLDVLDTYRGTLLEWQANTIVPGLKEEIRTLKGDVQGYKRKYEGEIAKCREVTEELKSLRATSMSAPVVPIIKPTVSVRGTPLTPSGGVPVGDREIGTGFGTALGSAVGGYGGSGYSKGFDPYNRDSGGLSKEGRKPDKVVLSKVEDVTLAKVEEVKRFLESWKTVHALLEAPHQVRDTFFVGAARREIIGL